MRFGGAKSSNRTGRSIKSCLAPNMKTLLMRVISVASATGRFAGLGGFAKLSHCITSILIG
jgi:hypothetical protein